MWEVRVNGELIDTYTDPVKAQVRARELREMDDNWDVRVDPAGALAETAEVEVTALPLSMRNTAV